MNNGIKVIFTGVFFIALSIFIWKWGFERFYVETNEMAIVTRTMFGDPLPPGQILADEGQKGIQANVLGEGRHFLNPVYFDHEIVPVTIIPPGKVGVVTSKVGQELPEGAFLAEVGEKGIWKYVLGPGKYRLNPHGYKIDVVDAISVPIGYSGVLTSLEGEQAPPGEFAGPNQKGVRKDILQPGLYYVNPKEYKTDILEIGVNQVSLLGRGESAVITKGRLQTANVAMEELEQKAIQEQKKKRLDYISKALSSRISRQESDSFSYDEAAPAAGRRVGMSPAEQEAKDLERMKREYLQSDSMATLGLAQYVEFPSRDGFQISLDMTVEFELPPDSIAGIYSKYGDLPAVVDKIIMPQITSVSRNKGSEYRAKDFIVGEGREKFQNDLTQTLAARLGQKHIVIHNALIRHVEVPMEILDPIQQASIAVEQDLTNKERQNTAKTLAELNTEISLIEQRREQVAQETEKIKAEIHADQEKQVAEIRAATLRNVAEIEKQSATIQAEKIRTIATADATALEMVEGERAKGQFLYARAFKDANAYNMWRFATSLKPDVDINIIHAGSGTLWTDLEKANLGELGGATMMQQKTR